MINDHLPLGQGLPRTAAGANESRCGRWYPLRSEDREIFERHRDARFIVRRFLEEDDLHNGVPGTADCNLLDMIGVTVVFRSGHRIVDWELPSHDSLRWIVECTLKLLSHFPALTADATSRNSSHNNIVDLDRALQLSVGMTYVDAPGRFWISDGLLIFRSFCEVAIEPFWRTILSARRDGLKGDFEANDSARRRAAKLLPRISGFRLFPSERKAGR